MQSSLLEEEEASWDQHPEMEMNLQTAAQVLGVQFGGFAYFVHFAAGSQLLVSDHSQKLDGQGVATQETLEELLCLVVAM